MPPIPLDPLIPMAQEGRVGDPAAEVEDTHLSIEMG